MFFNRLEVNKTSDTAIPSSDKKQRESAIKCVAFLRKIQVPEIDKEMFCILNSSFIVLST